MKTPREVLFERHRSATDKLDQIRQNTLASLSSVSMDKAERRPLDVTHVLWQELIRPCRPAWAMLVVVWAAILVFNLTQSAGRQVIVAKSTVAPGEIRFAFQEQKRLLAEIIGQAPPPPVAEPPKQTDTQPRSSRRATVVAV